MHCKNHNTADLYTMASHRISFGARISTQYSTVRYLADHIRLGTRMCWNSSGAVRTVHCVYYSMKIEPWQGNRLCIE